MITFAGNVIVTCCHVMVICHSVVFMGSEKYPGENSFDTFTAKHGGYGNACTGCEKVGFIKFSYNSQ